MKLTKGKWNLFLQDDNGYGITNGDSVIAIAGEDDLPENEANANLIASAPELLDLARMERDKHLFGEQKFKEIHGIGWNEIKKIRENLIAKAEGGA
jgi:hypothetical protein